jgi:tRNA threonylcarbamoyladenosine biosynthesis protein TsaE
LQARSPARAPDAARTQPRKPSVGFSVSQEWLPGPKARGARRGRGRQGASHGTAQLHAPRRERPQGRTTRPHGCRPQAVFGGGFGRVSDLAVRSVRGQSAAMPAALPRPDLPFRLDADLSDEAATRRFAAALAPLLRRGDTLLLEGPVGAGKTAFARALIGALQAAAGIPPEEVPSPSFTLVQTYAAGPLEIWHADLYRLSGPDECEELGLTEAFETAIVLVEWPDRLGARAPAGALTVTLSPAADAEARHLALHGPAEWKARLAPLAARGAAR